MYRGVGTHVKLTRAVKDYVNATMAFHAATFNERTSSTQRNSDAKDLKLIVRPDARVVNMETKIDTLAD